LVGPPAQWHVASTRPPVRYVRDRSRRGRHHTDRPLGVRSAATRWFPHAYGSNTRRAPCFAARRAKRSIPYPRPFGIVAVGTSTSERVRPIARSSVAGSSSDTLSLRR